MIALLVTCTALLEKTYIPGNVCFDPLNLCQRPLIGITAEETLFWYRAAEIKHGRLAMLAALAYPAQEVFNPVFAKNLMLQNTLAKGVLSPSLVNGNLDAETLIYLVGLGAAIELSQTESTFPADYGWRTTDPSVNPEAFFDLQAGEIWNGRIAMVAVLAYVVQEFLREKPVLFFWAQ